MKSLSQENQADINEAFSATSRYLEDLLNIDNIYFDQMMDRIYPTELKLNKANSSDTEAPFFFGFESMYNGSVSTKIYDKRMISILIQSISLFWMSMSPSLPHMGFTYLNLLDSPELLQILVTLFAVIKPLLPNFLGRAIIILNFSRRFSKFYRRHSAFVEKYNVGLKILLQQGISEPEFYGDLVYRFRKLVGKSFGAIQKTN